MKGEDEVRLADCQNEWRCLGNRFYIQGLTTSANI